MTSDRNRVILAEIFARVWRDSAYKEELKANPRKVLTEAGITPDGDYDICVLFNTDTEKYMLLPYDQSFEEIEAKVLNTLKVLLPLQEGKQLILRQNTSTLRHLIVPAPPQDPSGQPLGEDELDLVAGGGSQSVTSVETSSTMSVSYAAIVDAAEITAAVVNVQAIGVVVIV